MTSISVDFRRLPHSTAWISPAPPKVDPVVGHHRRVDLAMPRNSVAAPAGCRRCMGRGIRAGSGHTGQFGQGNAPRDSASGPWAMEVARAARSAALVEAAANEDELALRRAATPAIGRAQLEDAMHALQHVAAGVARQRHDALQSEDVVASHGDQGVQAGVEPLARKPGRR